MVKQSPEEIRRQVLAADAQKDVSIYLAIPVGVTAGISAVAAMCAVITMRALVYFRQGVDAHWLCCAPFLFPVVTGLFAAYKKQYALIGVHLSVSLLALLLGGFGFGLSVEPIFINGHHCLPVHTNVPCEKVPLSYLYLISGALAAGFAVLGFLLTLLALYSASRRMEQREYAAHLQHLKEQEEKQKELRQRRMSECENRRRALSVSSAGSNPATQTVPQDKGGN
ncbi:uncharacterized protein LOC143298101 [Babylonia areolata]|uniref:uncharacterized protein LOC143298101 n=1 Tax=Babylonia areolata TaxID=304850 RepID=UPI003FD27C6A